MKPRSLNATTRPTTSTGCVFSKWYEINQEVIILLLFIQVEFSTHLILTTHMQKIGNQN